MVGGAAGDHLLIRMRSVTIVSAFAVAALVVIAAYVVPASGEASGSSPSFVTELPVGYRDWRFVSIAREEGKLDDIRVILGNDTAIKAYREAKQPLFPNGSIVARLAYSYEASEENDKVFGNRQSFVAGHPKNGIQFMIRDSKRYAATGGWGYGQFDGGKSVDESLLRTCFPCHEAVTSRDFVFTRYAP
jgi:hypothetical protein